MRGALLLLASLLAVACRPPAPPPTAPEADPAIEILVREDRRVTEDGYLVSQLGSEDPRIRSRAALALGRIGDPATAAALGGVNDPDVSVRRMVAFALGEIADSAAVPPLVELLSDADPEVRALALEGLSKAADAVASRAARVHLAAETDPDALAAGLRWGFRYGDPDWIGPLIDATEAEGPLGEAAVYGLSRLLAPRFVEEHADAIDPAIRRTILDRFVAASAHPDRFVASVAVRGLGRFPELDHARREEVLRESLGRDDLSIRVQALGAYAELFAKRAIVWHELRSLPDHDHPSVRAAATAALGAVGGADAEDLIRRRLQAEDPVERAGAVAALFAVGPEAMNRDLSPLLDEDWRIRAALADGLGEVEYGRDVLRTLAADEDARVRHRALAGLGKHDPEALLAGLFDPDVVVRAVAADLIAEREDAARFATQLADSFAAATSDRVADARLSLLAALAAADRTAELSVALSDPDWLVRAKAAELLAARDGRDRPIDPPPSRPRAEYERALASPADGGKPARMIVTTSAGQWEMELLWEEAPLTCLNFVTLAERGYYDGLTYHRVVPDFVVQDGCPRGDGWGGPGHAIRCEINQERYQTGTVGMALSGKDTGGSQYFVTLTPTPHLDGGYTVFGRVVAGFDVVQRIRAGDRTIRIAPAGASLP